MKIKTSKTLLLLTIIVLSTVYVYSQENNGPIISFEENKFSFDTIIQMANISSSL